MTKVKRVKYYREKALNDLANMCPDCRCCLGNKCELYEMMEKVKKFKAPIYGKKRKSFSFAYKMFSLLGLM
jgi:hypothetical protein